MFWAILAFSIVAVTKYLTSMRLRTLFERIQSDQRAAEQLRLELRQTVDKEQVLRAEAEALASKATALQNIVETLERSLHGSSEGSVLAAEE